MTPRVAVLCSMLLTGCTGGGSSGLADQPIEITTLTPSYDSAQDSVDLSLAFTNTSYQPLRSVQVSITAYDSAGRLVQGGAVAQVRLEGPYPVNAKVGPSSFAHLWSGSDVRCLEISQVSLTFLDYATTLISDTAANQLVAADTRRICRGALD